MLKKLVKYLLIIGANALLLTLLLALYTDEVTLRFSPWTRSIEFLKIIGVSFILLMGMRVLVGYCRKKQVPIKKRIQYSVILAVVLSGWFYGYYTYKIVDNHLINKTIRTQITKKTVASNVFPFTAIGSKLTNEEYNFITQLNWYPKLPTYANNINFSYWADGFLPDYTFTLTYDIPLDKSVDTTKFSNNKTQFTKHNTVVVHKNHKTVTYVETVQ